ncbi:hypothetical protein [Metabacillus niabensis]|uniref:Uncharacterized protein n=1 Tax=Metabacillus niabensis TaxID=324854 RepID=A0ABT9Z515_9BACI|nr:hypothetical protein [Metabacillus niabensis]MDQ0226683.1 hypothetical protein [Metabacillus niabensis]PAD68975.1 hypothetical protein CHH83_10685 [Bacillus sp. 7586-K]
MAYDDLFEMGRGRFGLDMFSPASQAKVSHDRYDVYVNDDFVGQKYLLTAQESVHDIDEFLMNEGQKDFHSYLDGDHYYIRTQTNEQSISNVLKVYLQNR